MTGPLRFGVLGTLTVERGGVSVRVSGARDRAVLARLALDANRVVSVDRLCEAVWQDEPPRTARSQIAICVSRLRGALGDPGDGSVIATAKPGYLLRLDEESSDHLRFSGLAARARAAAGAGQRETAIGLLREALGLWRGTPFEDLPGMRHDIDRLEEAKLSALELWADLHLALGRHQAIEDTLRQVVAQHPLRERAQGHLMLALYRSGRRADALRTYQSARRVLVEQIGLEPGPELHDLHERVLRDDPSLLAGAPGAPGAAASAASAAPAAAAAPGAPGAVPWQLPRQSLPFAGRLDALAALDAALPACPEAADPGIVVLCGASEVGKTALALRWAHQRADRFADGLLYADLREEPNAHAVLGRFLHALGVPGAAVPQDSAERAALYRSTVAGRRVLVVLDAAADDVQVTQLLPGGNRCQVVVASREPLEELVVRQGARRHVVEPLAAGESWDLLAMLVGAERVAANREKARRIVEQAGGFPLRLRRAAARWSHHALPRHPGAVVPSGGRRVGLRARDQRRDSTASSTVSRASAESGASVVREAM